MKNKIDLVYILGTGSRWSDNEIRFSLRSVEKYFKYNKVFIIGEKPEWLTGVIHIKAHDGNSNKLLNAREKYRIACTDKRISKDFILMNDDFFFLKSVDEIENYSRGTLEEMIEKHPTKSGYYFKSLMDTCNKLRSLGFEDPIDFEIHGPMIFNKEKLLTVMGVIGEDPHKAYSLRSCYGNMMHLKPKKIMDFKAMNLAEFALQVREDRELLSINDGLVAEDYFRDWIERRFKKPSMFEMDEGIGQKVLPGRTIKQMKYHATKMFQFNGKTFNPGDIIDKETASKLKEHGRMRGLWRLD